MKVLAVVDKSTNKVINLAAWDDVAQPDPSIFGNYRYEYVEYDENIHPWGQLGPINIEIGTDWKQKYEAIKPLEVDPHLQEATNNAN